jgi:Carboxypeptidase regulatory-like domain
MKTPMRWVGLAAILILSLTLSCASTSSPTGSVRGLAVDNSGNPLPGITVSLQTQEGKLVQTVLTGADGSYSVQDVPEGKYVLTTTFAGFTAPKPVAAIVIAGAMVNLPNLVLVPPS